MAVNGKVSKEEKKKHQKEYNLNRKMQDEENKRFKKEQRQKSLLYEVHD